MIFVVSGCGSDSDDETEEITCSESLSCPSGGTLGGFIEWLSGACTTSTVCSSDQFITPWELGALEETEPNDSMQEALPVFIEDNIPGILAGTEPTINISGSVSPTDVVDYVAFSTDSPRKITIYFCPSFPGGFGCGSRITYPLDVAYMDILDVNGNTIASTNTPLGPSGREIVMAFTPMQVYFVRIVIYNLTVEEFEYRLVLLNGVRSVEDL